MIFEKEFILGCGVWQDEYIIIFSTDIKASAEKRVAQLGLSRELPNNDDTGCFIDIREANDEAGIILFNLETTDEGFIVHESFHIVLKILKWRNITLNAKTEEVYAYTLQWLFNEVKNFHQQALSEYEKQKAV